MSHDFLLPDDIWQFIGFKLDSVADRIRFRAVSKTWNSLLPARLPPWLVLSGEGENEDEIDDQEEEEEETEAEAEAVVSLAPPPCRGFVSLGEDRIYEFDCPQLHQARMIGSTGNWLITVHPDASLRLLNPFSKQVMLLPSPLPLDLNKAYTGHSYLAPNTFRDSFLSKLVLSSPPSQSQHSFIAVAIYDFRLHLAFARAGDESWTPFQTPYYPEVRNLYIQDVAFYKQRFYAIDRWGKLIVCDFGNNDSSHPPKLCYLNDGIQFEYRFPAVYLVEWVGELLLVMRIVENLENPDDYKTKGFELYKLGSENRWNEIKSLGEHSLFLGYNTSVSLLASDYYGLMKRNCIYFTDNYAFGFRGNRIPGGRDMGVYDLEDGTITPHFRGVSTSLFSPPVWIIPSDSLACGAAF